MDALASAGTLLLHLAQARSKEQRDVGALASGLRVQGAVDDPSGFAIASTMSIVAAGLQQGAENVQLANNLLTVAQAAALNVQQILQRMYGLVMEAGSDLQSLSNLQQIQNEIDQLIHEIDAIAQNASFNGVKLFDGSHDTYVGAAPGVDVPATVIMVTPPTNPDGTIPTTQVYDAANLGTYNPAPLIQNARMSSFQETEGYWLLQITGPYSTNPVDPMLGPLGQPGLYMRGVEYSTDPNFAGATGGQENIGTQALPTNMGNDFGSGGSLQITTPGAWIGDFTTIAFDMPNLSPQDVGVADAFITIDAKPTAGGTALQVNANGQEGGVISVSLPTLNAGALDVSRISVLPATLYDNFDNATGTDSSNQYAVADSLARVQYAIDSLGQVVAQIGSQQVALQTEAGNSNAQAVAQIASASAIRDVNIGTAVEDMTRQSILDSLGTQLLARLYTDAYQVAQIARAA